MLPAMYISNYSECLKGVAPERHNIPHILLSDKEVHHESD